MVTKKLVKRAGVILVALAFVVAPLTACAPSVGSLDQVGQLRNMVYRGQLEHRKFCRRLYFRRTDLERAIETSFKGGLSWQ